MERWRYAHLSLPARVPFEVSPFPPHAIYCGRNYVHKRWTRGTWQKISARSHGVTLLVSRKESERNANHRDANP